MNVSVLFKAIDAITAPARAMRASIGGITQATDSLAKVSRVSNAITEASNAASATAVGAKRSQANSLIDVASAATQAATTTRVFNAATEASNAASATAVGTKRSQANSLINVASAATKATTATSALKSASVASAAGFTQQAAAATQAATAVTQAASKISVARAQLDHVMMSGVTGSLVGGELRRMGGSIARPFGDAITVAGDFGAMMSAVGAVAEASNSELKALDDQARYLGAHTAYTATQAAEGMRFLATAGFRANQIIDAMPATLDLARAGIVDLGQAADIGANILTGFGLEASKMTHVADVLSYTINSSQTDLSDLGETMKYVAPIAHGLSISLEQTAAMAGLLANNGIKGSQAGTTLRAALLRLAVPKNISSSALASMGMSAGDLASGAGEASSALASLGIDAKDAEGNLLPIAQILKEIANATADLGEAERIGIISKIFGVEAATGMAVLVQAAAKGGLEQYLAEIEAKADGSAKRTSEKMGANFKGAMIEMKSAWEGLKISVGTPMGNFLAPFIRTITLGVRAVTWLGNAMPPVAGAIGLVVGGLGLTVLAGGTLIGTVTSLVVGIAALNLALTVCGVRCKWLEFDFLRLRWEAIRTSISMYGLSGSLRNLAAGAVPMLMRGITLLTTIGFPALIAGLQAVWGFLVTNPLGWIVIGIAAIVFVIYRLWNPLKSFFNSFWTGFKEGAAPIFGTIQTIGKELVRFWALLAPFRKFISNPLSIFGDFKFQKLMNGFGEFMGKLSGSFLVNRLTREIEFLSWAMDKLNQGWNWASSLPGVSSAIKAINDALQWTIAMGTRIWTLFKTGINQTFEALYKTLKDIVTSLEYCARLVAAVFGLVAAPPVWQSAFAEQPAPVPTASGEANQGSDNSSVPRNKPESLEVAVSRGSSRNAPLIIGEPQASAQTNTYQFNIYAAPGQSSQDIAREVEAILRARDNRDKRSSLYDYDNLKGGR
ncbi:MAG: phage tail tape measure protein [Verrucomicrobiota bacterium]|nr:phage tail tape measure protein [Verrucomicrobiota bacterium]